MERPDWAPKEVSPEEPSIARIWDWFLGGSHNFAADREVARKTLELMPEGPRMAQLSRAFLRRAVRYCISAGITQFLDVGSGIPTVGNVHEVAQREDPQARVVYVDVDPVAVAHTRQILGGNERATVIQADLRSPAVILEHSEVHRMLDLSRPVALLMVSVLHFVSDAQRPGAIIRRYRKAMAPGSLLVIGHGSDDTEGMPQDHLHTARAMYERSVAPVSLRSRAEVEALFGGFELVDPGVVWIPQWRPDPGEPERETDTPVPLAGYAGVARRP
jgi:SAM-dependent methyltransferase